jgi:hypothetical protein
MTIKTDDIVQQPSCQADGCEAEFGAPGPVQKGTISVAGSFEGLPIHAVLCPKHLALLKTLRAKAEERQ